MTMPYYAVPVSVLEDAERLVQWGKRAVAVAKATKASKPTKSTTPRSNKLKPQSRAAKSTR
jgi:TfoX/Sxy family transcriptional regulator of competence genes